MNFKTFPSFGSKIAYAEPSWYQKRATCFYNESHVEFRNLCRQFVEKEIMPFVHEWDEGLKFLNFVLLGFFKIFFFYLNLILFILKK